MLLVRLFATTDLLIGRLPPLLAHTAAALVVAGFSTAYAYLATGHWWTRQYQHNTQEKK